MFSSRCILAERLSEFAHFGQVYGDKGKNQPPDEYFCMHILKVADHFNTDATEHLKTLAYLHDILEDTDITYDTLNNLFGKQIADEILILTRSPEETYKDYILRVAKNNNCRLVKIADVRENLKYCLEKNNRPSLIERYQMAMELLTK